MRTIAVLNLKGGVGKTTITHNLAGVLAERGARVLLLDFDHQANLSSIYIPHLTESDENGGLTRALFEGIPLSEVIKPTQLPTVWIAPADLDLNLLDARFSNDIASHFVLADLLEREQSKYDFALIDCPPHLGMAVGMALVAADAYLIPLDLDRWAYRGSQRAQDAAQRTRRRANQDLTFLGYVASKVQARSKLSQQMLAFLQEKFGNDLKPTSIRESVKYRESAAMGLPITHYLPSSEQAADFRTLAQELQL
jgi:chromosome partitioning protein